MQGYTASMQKRGGKAAVAKREPSGALQRSPLSPGTTEIGRHFRMCILRISPGSPVNKSAQSDVML
ncbi:hypothetical protein SK3146_02946 [Paenibacillus konkukensis]|uniref:Uncharacterized protein n=1 Tax=Paenibacillus konkukensis TaxID=2020716 RepID=A0ABY4RMP3_9BACL|nr:hypothetical protein SK3146_02946 [Paenibacillus konkukensis]